MSDKENFLDSINIDNNLEYKYNNLVKDFKILANKILELKNQKTNEMRIVEF